MTQALLVFETCLTADLELEYIWARGRARMIVLFLAIRHVLLVNTILGSITLAFPSPAVSHFALGTMLHSPHFSWLQMSVKVNTTFRLHSTPKQMYNSQPPRVSFGCDSVYRLGRFVSPCLPFWTSNVSQRNLVVFLGWRAYALTSSNVLDAFLVFICSASFAIPSIVGFSCLLIYCFD